MVASDCREMAFGGPSCPFQFYTDAVVHKLQSEKTWDRKGSLSDRGLARPVDGKLELGTCEGN